jgi:S-(hydroxymethyl)glutathione dehydrogenase/alcohol dehydrogenase
VIAVDNQAAKETMARQFGATDFVDSSQVDVLAALKDLVPGGLDVTFEAVGHTGLLRTAIDALGPGGTCVVLGVPPFGQEASFMVAGLYQDKAILGCRYGSSRPRADITMLAGLYLAGRLKLDELVSRTYPLDGVEQVFADMHAGELARGVLVL